MAQKKHTGWERKNRRKTQDRLAATAEKHAAKREKDAKK